MRRLFRNLAPRPSREELEHQAADELRAAGGFPDSGPAPPEVRLGRHGATVPEPEQADEASGPEPGLEPVPEPGLEPGPEPGLEPGPEPDREPEPEPPPAAQGQPRRRTRKAAARPAKAGTGARKARKATR